MSKERFDPAQAITDEIIALLEEGTMPWRRPWRIAGDGVPLRVGGEGYRGINAFLLGLRAAIGGYSSPYWMTFRQAKELGACVKKGARSSIVVYYGTATRGQSEPEGDAGRNDGDAANSTYRFLKSYRVFNAEQVEGLDPAFHPEPEGAPGDGPDPVPEIQTFFEAVGGEVVFGGDRACYVPALDRIHLPEMSRFESAQAFYATWAHEYAHWTKTETRLDRSFGSSQFGNEAYVKEELVAELSAVLMGQRLGFCADHLENHAAYLGAWLRILRNDRRFLFKAGADAQRAVDFLVAAAESRATERPAAA